MPDSINTYQHLRLLDAIHTTSSGNTLVDLYWRYANHKYHYYVTHPEPNPSYKLDAIQEARKGIQHCTLALHHDESAVIFKQYIAQFKYIIKHLQRLSTHH